MPNPYTVDHWCSHPDQNNDDCQTGYDFPTLAKAEEALEKGSQSYFVAFLELKGPDGLRKVVANPNYDAARVERENRQEDRDAQSEYAMQAGMAFGVEGYNDAMGWSSESPED